MRADQKARSLTYHPKQQFTSDVLCTIPPDAMHGRETLDGSWRNVVELPLGVFQPKDVDRLYVLGGCADVSREQAERLMRPIHQIAVGSRIGREAALAEFHALGLKVVSLQKKR